MSHPIDPDVMYRIRSRGVQRPAVEGHRLPQLVRDFVLARHDELSEDGELWFPASEVELFAPVYALKALIVMFTTECVVTNSRILGKTGFLSRNSTELLLKQVEGLQISQGIAGRIFNFGTLSVTGTGSSLNRFPGIVDPMAFRQAAQEQIAIAQR